ncbi:MAG: enoyl-CoA hydratase-related protein [Solirubrobacterales bacterium]
MAELVLSERRGGVLVLTLNRPDRLNAWTDAMGAQYHALLEAAEADPAVKAIVVTGAGRGFCAGADLGDLEVAAESNELKPGLGERIHPDGYPRTIRKPLVCAINGAVAGRGLVEALNCDVRFCAPEAKLTTAFARRGLIAEYGISWLLPRLVGTSAALDLLLSGRIVRGAEAQRLGLVDHLVEPADLLTAAVAFADDLATNCSPTSMAIIKAQVQADLDRSFAEATTVADEEMLTSFQRPDVAEGVASYSERRPPAFPPLAPTRS